MVRKRSRPSRPLMVKPIKKQSDTLTHQDVCEFAGKWLRTKLNCGISFVEHKVAHSDEIPDALGFRDYGGTSILIEVKVSRGDFLGDKKKPHRMNPDQGIGDYRFYCAPKGIIKVSDLPPGWGLLECSPTGRIKVLHGPHKDVLTQLPGVDILRERIESDRLWREKHDKDGTMGQYTSTTVKRCQDFLFPHKNRKAERELMYGAMRMWFVASEAGVDCNLTEKFYTNPMKGQRKDTIDSCRNMSR